jgi:uncharacterized membrane protein
MTRLAAAYAVALVLFLILDALWLGVVARNFYMSRIGDLILDQPRWGVAVIFYAVYIVGLVYFGVSTGFGPGGEATAALNGGLFGFFAYLTYNATNLSTLKGYSSTIAVVDTLWGTVMGAAVAFLTIVILGAMGLADSE